MESERWSRVRRLFEAVLDVPEPQRDAWLERELGGDGEAAASADEVRAAVRQLIAAEAGLDDFLEPLPTADDPWTSAAAVLEPPALEAFQIVRPLGVGGMGAVYEAEQKTPRRRVALKVLHPTGRSPDMLRRFADEVELLARLQHPGIARIYDAGVEAGDAGDLPWFAMELVDGACSLVEFADRQTLSLTARLELLRRVCDAVHHGHQRGVLHRDLKPGNLLVGRDGRPVVIDFGVARATDAAPDATHATQPGTLVGTLAYMSPEQVAGPAGELDVRTDVYSLGVVLYELIAGQLPFELEELPITRAARAVCEDDPPAPSSLRRELPHELDWIVERALAKDREERYESALELGRDLDRFLKREALAAGPRTHGYRVRAFVRRNRLAVGAASVVALAILGGLVGTGLGLIRALAAEKQADEERAIARTEADKAGAVTEFLVDVLASAEPGHAGLDAPVKDVLERAATAYRERFDDQTVVRARLGAVLGEVFHRLGADERAEEELRESLAALEGDHEAWRRELANSEGQLGTILLKSGRLAEAETLLESSLAFHRDGDAPDRDLYRALGRLGQLRLAQEQREEAEQLLREAHAGLREHQGPQHRDTCLIANALAGVLHESKRFEEAEPIYREALAGLRAYRGNEHPDTLRLRHNFGMLQFHLSDDPNEAIPELNGVYEVRSRVLGPDHPDTLASLANLAGLLHLARRLDEAATLYAGGLSAARRTLDLEHATLQALTMNAAALERERGNYVLAAELVDAVHGVRLRTLGEGSEATLNAVFARIQIDSESGAGEDALLLCRAGLDAVHEHMGPDTLFAYHFEREGGRVLLALGRHVEAGEWLEACRRTHEAILERYPQLPGPEPEFEQLAAFGVGHPVDAEQP